MDHDGLSKVTYKNITYKSVKGGTGSFSLSFISCAYPIYFAFSSFCSYLLKDMSDPINKSFKLFCQVYSSIYTHS